jgi:hypothetical protein
LAVCAVPEQQFQYKKCHATAFRALYQSLKEQR